jgi:uncharacterized protein (TIGR00255 family)
MTGYAAESFEFDEYTLFIEIRSLNNKFLEVKCKLPFYLEHMEENLRKTLKRTVKRGKVEIFVKVVAKEEIELRMLRELFVRYGKLVRMIEQDIDVQLQLSLSDLLSLRYFFNDFDEITKIDIPEDAFKRCFGKTLDMFQESRRAEGEMTKAELNAFISEIEETIGQIEAVYPGVVDKFREQTRQRVRQLIESELDETRLMMEVAVFASKVDISEEVSRIKSHMKKMRQVIDGDGACGRELDFMAQELNREINTVGAKSPEYTISENAVRIKTVLEKIKEQVRNIE